MTPEAKQNLVQRTEEQVIETIKMVRCYLNNGSLFPRHWWIILQEYVHLLHEVPVFAALDGYLDELNYLSLRLTEKYRLLD